MPICADDRATNGVPFVFIYSAIFKRLKLRLPFTFFEKEMMKELKASSLVFFLCFTFLYAHD